MLHVSAVRPSSAVSSPKGRSKSTLPVHLRPAFVAVGGHAVAQLVEALRCKPEGRGFDSPIGSLEFFIDIILPAALWPLGSTQPLTEMGTRYIFWG